MQPHGSVGSTQYLVLNKQTALSQIPALHYSAQAMANLPRPNAWDDKKLSLAALSSVKFTTLGYEVHDPTLPALDEPIADLMSPQLLPLWEYCETRDVISASGLESAPSDLQRMLGVHHLRPLMLKYLH